MKDTKIGWPHIARPDGTLMPGYTLNPWWGCEKAIGHGGDNSSPACDNCYAEAFAHRLGKDLWGAGSARRLDFEAAHDAETGELVAVHGQWARDECEHGHAISSAVEWLCGKLNESIGSQERSNYLV